MTDQRGHAMTDIPELLPCPFCGHAPRSYGAQVMVNGECPESIDCDSDTCPIHPTTGYLPFEEARAAWNTRADLIPAMLATARREALEEAAKVCEADSNLEISLCCDGHHCGCRGASVGEYIAYQLRALAASPPTPTPVDGENSADPGGKGGA